MCNQIFYEIPFLESLQIKEDYELENKFEFASYDRL